MYEKYQDLLSEMFEIPNESRLPVTDWAVLPMPDAEVPKRYTDAMEKARSYFTPS